YSDVYFYFFFSSRRRHTRSKRDWSSDVCSSDLMYLANKGYKIANIPLVPEVDIPDEVFRNKNLKVFGLTASPTYILNIRTERVKVLGLHGPTDYNSVD